jgi:sec-independent protein translocase protein TatA
MFPAIGMQEMLVIMVVILLLFGSKKLPGLARGLGKSMREFKKAAEDVKREIDLSDDI